MTCFYIFANNHADSATHFGSFAKIGQRHVYIHVVVTCAVGYLGRPGMRACADYVTYGSGSGRIYLEAYMATEFVWALVFI